MKASNLWRIDTLSWIAGMRDCEYLYETITDMHHDKFKAAFGVEFPFAEDFYYESLRTQRDAIFQFFDEMGFYGFFAEVSTPIEPENFALCRIDYIYAETLDELVNKCNCLVATKTATA